MIRERYPDRVEGLTDSLDSANIVLYRNISDSCVELIKATLDGKNKWNGFNMAIFEIGGKIGSMYVFWPDAFDKPIIERVEAAINLYRPIPLNCLLAHYAPIYASNQMSKVVDYFAISDKINFEGLKDRCINL